MSLHDVWELGFSLFRGKAVCVEPAEENLSTDAGLLVLRQFDEQHGFISDFAEQLDDPRRDPSIPNWKWSAAACLAFWPATRK